MTTTNKLVVVITGSDSGFGHMSAKTLALDRHIVYGGLLHPRDTHPDKYNVFTDFAQNNGCDIRGIHLNITDDAIISQAVEQVIKEQGRIDVVVHNAGHMSLGAAEAFAPEQFFDLYDTNCVGCHRLNRAVLPHMRQRRSGLLLWVSSSSAHGPSSPYLSAYFAAKAAQDSLAQTTALEVSQWGIESCIVTPGIFTSGTDHFSSAMKPKDEAIAREYEEGPMKGWLERCLEGSANMGRLPIEPQGVADSIAAIVRMEPGTRPWRAHVEPEGPMAERVNEVRDEVRKEYLTRLGCEQLMHVKLSTNH